MSLDTLKRNSGLDKLLTAVQKDTAPVEKQSYVDERFWKPELDKTGNGFAPGANRQAILSCSAEFGSSRSRHSPPPTAAPDHI